VSHSVTLALVKALQRVESALQW